MVTSLPFQTLRGRLMLLACLATLPAFFFVIYLATKDRAAALDRTEVELLYVADSASQEHANQIYGAHRLLERLASLSHGETSVDLPTLLPPILMGFPQFANLGILDLNGETIFSVVPLPRPVNMTQVPAFQEALDSNKVAIGTYLIGLIVERPILIMAKALRDSDTQPKWVLFAALELAWLDQLAKQAGLPPDSALLIVDRDGNILASSLELDLSNPVPKRLKGFKSLLQNPSTLGMCETLDNIPRLAVARPLEGVKDLWVVVGTPKSKVYAIANSVFFRDLAALTFLTMLAIICSLFATDVSVLHDIRILLTQRAGSVEAN